MVLADSPAQGVLMLLKTALLGSTCEEATRINCDRTLPVWMIQDLDIDDQTWLSSPLKT